MPDTFGKLTEQTVCNWKRVLENSDSVPVLTDDLPTTTANPALRLRADGNPAEKRGPKVRSIAPGEFYPWNNRRVPVATLVVLASLIMGQVAAGIPLTVGTILVCAIGTFSSAGISWTLSIGWARVFAGRIGLTFRKGTRAARSLPPDFESVKKTFLLRVIWTVCTHSVPPELFFNADETGVKFFPVRGTTWGVKGSKQVDVENVDDKRQFTVTPIVSATGSIAGPVQVVWQGKTKACCPKESIQKEFQKQLSHFYSPTHWSTPDTVRHLVGTLWKEHVLPVMLRMQLNPIEQKWVLLWDVYSSHRDHGVLVELRATYPNLIILFVPANTTCELQPLDTGFNFPFKSSITRSACKWLSALISQQLSDGVQPGNVAVPKTKAALTQPFCGWLNDAVVEMSTKPETIRRAFVDTGIMLAWDTSSSTHFAWRADALALQESEKLWCPLPSAKRFKSGKVSQTQITVSGLDGDDNDLEDECDDDGNLDDLRDDDELAVFEVATSMANVTTSESEIPAGVTVTESIAESDPSVHLPISMAESIGQAIMRRSGRNLSEANARLKLWVVE